MMREKCIMIIDNKQMNKKVFWVILILCLAVIGGLVYWNLSQHNELTELVEQMQIEKEELQEE